MFIPINYAFRPRRSHTYPHVSILTMLFFFSILWLHSVFTMKDQQSFKTYFSWSTFVDLPQVAFNPVKITIFIFSKFLVVVFIGKLLQEQCSEVLYLLRDALLLSNLKVLTCTCLLLETCRCDRLLQHPGNFLFSQYFTLSTFLSSTYSIVVLRRTHTMCAGRCP